MPNVASLYSSLSLEVNFLRWQNILMSNSKAYTFCWIYNLDFQKEFGYTQVQFSDSDAQYNWPLSTEWPIHDAYIVNLMGLSPISMPGLEMYLMKEAATNLKMDRLKSNTFFLTCYDCITVCSWIWRVCFGLSSWYTNRVNWQFELFPLIDRQDGGWEWIWVYCTRTGLHMWPYSP